MPDGNAEPVPGPPPLRIRGLKASPHAVTPNGDWSGESTTVRFGLTRRAVLEVRIVNASRGGIVDEEADESWFSVG